MTNYPTSLSSHQMDQVFGALSDSTRRDILERLTTSESTVSELAKPYHFSLPTISEHISVLEKAKLVTKNKIGREYKVTFEPNTIRLVADYVSFYNRYWNLQLDNLEKFLEKKR